MLHGFYGGLFMLFDDLIDYPFLRYFVCNSIGERKGKGWQEPSQRILLIMVLALVMIFA